MKKIKIVLASLFVFLGISFSEVQALGTTTDGVLGNFDYVGETVGGAVNNRLRQELNSFLNDKLGLKTTPDGELSLPDAKQFGAIGENTSIRLYLQKVVNFVLSFLGLIAVIFLIYAGYLYVVDGGGDGLKDKAKKIIIYVSIGILVILASYALVNTLIQEAPRGGDDRRGADPTNPGASGQIDFSFETQDSDSLFF